MIGIISQIIRLKIEINMIVGDKLGFPYHVKQYYSSFSWKIIDVCLQSSFAAGPARYLGSKKSDHFVVVLQPLHPIMIMCKVQDKQHE